MEDTQNMAKNRYRMYSIAMRHLSGIQKGIQSWHAGQHYANKYGDTKEFKQWATQDETIIVLEAGTTDQLRKAVNKLRKRGVKVAEFKEPDFDNALTAIAFVLDERVSPSYSDVDDGNILAIRNIIKPFPLASN